jgi:hypothetical protein
MRKKILFILLTFTSIITNAQVNDLPEILKETSDQHEERMAWWHDAKFGMFIHWGLYSIKGQGEWAMWNQQISVEEYARQANELYGTHKSPSRWF